MGRRCRRVVGGSTHSNLSHQYLPIWHSHTATGTSSVLLTSTQHQIHTFISLTWTCADSWILDSYCSFPQVGEVLFPRTQTVHLPLLCAPGVSHSHSSPTVCTGTTGQPLHIDKARCYKGRSFVNTWQSAAASIPWGPWVGAWPDFVTMTSSANALHGYFTVDQGSSCHWLLMITFLFEQTGPNYQEKQQLSARKMLWFSNLILDSRTRWKMCQSMTSHSSIQMVWNFRLLCGQIPFYFSSSLIEILNFQNSSGRWW